MTQQSEFAQRLRLAMTEAGYEARPVVLEREFNTRYRGRSVSLQAVRRWLMGESIPTQDKLQVLADWLRIEPDALRYGLSAASVAHPLQAGEGSVAYRALTPEVRALLKDLMALPPAQQELLRQLIDIFLQAQRNGTQGPVSRPS